MTPDAVFGDYQLNFTRKKQKTLLIVIVVKQLLTKWNSYFLQNRPPPPFLNNVFQRHIGGLRPVIDPEEPVILPIVEPLLHEEEPPLALNWQPPNRRGVNNLPPRARYPPMAARLNAAAPANPFRNQAPMNVPQPPLNRPQQIPFPYM